MKVGEDLWISEQAVDRAKQTIQMALPKGEWRLVFKVVNGEQSNIKTKIIDVK